MLDPEVAYVNTSGSFPDTVGVNASGPAAQDGFEFVANFVNDNNLGIHQMILDRAGLTPNGIVESASGTSQIKEGLQKGFGGFPGKVHQWHVNLDPGVTGHRALLLHGQGVLRANYPELDAACYVGDANNAAVAAVGGGYYRADDAAGTIPNIVGVYIILPETRGYAPRGLDPAATVDPQGASRFLGDNQVDAMQRITGSINGAGAVGFLTPGSGLGALASTAIAATTFALQAGAADATLQYDNSGSTTPNAAKTDDVETRMANYSTKWVVWY
jgi:hypothetical protein